MLKPAAPISIAAEVPSTESDAHTKQAKEWLDRCLNCHDVCKGIGNTANNLRRRLVYVSPQTSLESVGSIKIQEVGENDHEIEYLALSHCWGGSDDSFKLLEAKKDSMLQNINIFSL